MNKKFKWVMPIFAFILLGLSSLTSNAAVFNIVPKAGTTLPTQVVIGNTVEAYYTVTNTTGSFHSGDYVKYLPPNTSQVTSNGHYPDLCGATFNLDANESCTLQLNVTGAINVNDPNQKNHLFVCLGGCSTCCAGTNFGLNVVPVSGPVLLSITISPLNDTIPIAGGLQYTATGYYSDGTTADLTSLVSWSSVNQSVATISSSGLALGLTAGTTTISATLGVLSSSTSLVVKIRAYIANAGGLGNVSVCDVNSTDGSIGTCQLINDATFNNPFGIILNNSANYAYIANYDSSDSTQGTVSICPVIHSTGQFSPCTSTQGLDNTATATIQGPQKAMLNPDNTYLYVANNPNFGIVGSTVSICPLTGDGATIGVCTTSIGNDISSNQTFNEPQDIAFSADGSHIYVANINSTVSVCPVTNGGATIGACTTSTGNGTFTKPWGLSFNLARTYLYVTNYGPPDNIAVCQIAPDGFSIGTCTIANDPTFDFSTNANTEAQLWMQDTIGYGYVPNAGSISGAGPWTISVCQLQNGGVTLAPCIAYEDSTFNQPSSITLR